MKTKMMLLALAGFLILTDSALAMSSTHYRIDWYVPLTGAAGGSVASSHYAADLTVGQVGIRAASGVHYDIALGFWPNGSAGLGWINYLPFIRRGTP